VRLTTLITTATRSATPGAAAAGLALLVLAACDGGVDRSQLEPGNQVVEEYAAELNVDLDAMELRPTGLHVDDVVAGEGERADTGDIVVVHYTGWLPDGTEFDSSHNRDAPFEVMIGNGQVIHGWDQGIVGMREGGQRRLVIPPAMAYGERGRGPIPANSTLVFDVELVNVVDRSGSPRIGRPRQ